MLNVAVYVNTLPGRDAFIVKLPHVFFVEDMFSFLMKTNLSSEDIEKCPNVLLFGNLNSENSGVHLWKLLGEMNYCSTN